MKEFFMIDTLHANDLLALVLCAGILILKVLKVETGIDDAIFIIVGFYFGQRNTTPTKSL
jgi:hypothetical protein